MTETKINLPFLNKKIDLSAFVIAAMLAFTIATGFVNQTVLSFGIVACCAVLFL